MTNQTVVNQQQQKTSVDTYHAVYNYKDFHKKRHYFIVNQDNILINGLTLIAKNIKDANKHLKTSQLYVESEYGKIFFGHIYCQDDIDNCKITVL